MLEQLKRFSPDLLSEGDRPDGMIETPEGEYYSREQVDSLFADLIQRLKSSEASRDRLVGALTTALPSKAKQIQ